MWGARTRIVGIGLAAALLAVVLLLKFARAPVAANATGGTATLATPWGEPDLQGIWTRDTNEPLHRPAGFKDRAFLTDEERAELTATIADIVSRESDENRRPRGTEQDVSGGYSAAIFTSHLPVGRRTSMVVDPPDGRIPPMTPEMQRREDERGRQRQCRGLHRRPSRTESISRANVSSGTGGRVRVTTAGAPAGRATR